MGDQLPTKSLIEFWVYSYTTGNFITKICLQIANAKSTSIILIYITSWNSVLVVDSSLAKLRKVNYQWAQNHQCVVHVWGCHSEDPAAHVPAHMKEGLEESATNSCPALLSPSLQIRQCPLFTSGIYSWCVWTHWIMQFKPIHKMYIPPEVFFGNSTGDQKRWRNTGIEQIIQPICSHPG